MNTTGNGAAALEFDKLIADFRAHLQQLHASNERLEQENAHLRQQVMAWKERYENCAALVRNAEKILQTPEEVEEVFRHGQWVDYQEIARAVAQVEESAHG